MIEAVKVMIKSLASEAKIIRQEENKQRRYYSFIKNRHAEVVKKGNKFQYTNPLSFPDENVRKYYEQHSQKFKSLRDYRKTIIGLEARAAHLAYAFLRGKSYDHVERNTDLIPLIVRRKDFHKPNSDFHTTLERVAQIASEYGTKKVEYNDIYSWVCQSLEKYEEAA